MSLAFISCLILVLYLNEAYLPTVSSKPREPLRGVIFKNEREVSLFCTLTYNRSSSQRVSSETTTDKRFKRKKKLPWVPPCISKQPDIRLCITESRTTPSEAGESDSSWLEPL